MDAKSIADKYITRDGRAPLVPESKIVWAPIHILDKEIAWLTKAITRNGYLPSRERDGADAPFLSDLRYMHERGLVRGMPWRITKFGRECMRELEARTTAERATPVLAAPESVKPIEPPREIEVRPMAEVERELITAAIDKFNGNKSHAAKALGLSIRTIRNKVNSYKSADARSQE